jgi:hypothetical protein
MTTLDVHYRNPDFADAIAAHRLDKPESIFDRYDGPWVGARTYGSLLRETIDGIGPVYIKRYDYDRAILHYRLIGSRSYREWASSVRMARIGITQPETITVASRRNRLGITGSFIITREVPMATSLESLVDNPEAPPDDALLDGLADALVHLITRMHQGGFCHWDLKPRNVIVSCPGNELVLIPVDAVNGRSIRPWNRRHCIHRDYRYLLSHPRLGPRMDAHRSP